MVSDHGRVWAYPRTVVRHMRDGRIFEQTYKSKLMSLNKSTSQHLQASLTDSQSSHNKEFVHRLVALAFVKGRTENTPLVRHLDDVKTNNHFKNLRWGTAQQNTDDYMRNGRQVILRGEQATSAKLTEKQVRAIRRAFAAGATKAELARAYDISHTSMTAIVNRTNWTHI